LGKPAGSPMAVRRRGSTRRPGAMPRPAAQRKSPRARIRRPATGRSLVRRSCSSGAIFRTLCRAFRPICLTISAASATSPPGNGLEEQPAREAYRCGKVLRTDRRFHGRRRGAEFPRLQSHESPGLLRHHSGLLNTAAASAYPAHDQRSRPHGGEKEFTCNEHPRLWS
jgi:hypothetical protein